MQRGQPLSAQQAALALPRRLEPARHTLDHFAVQDNHLEATQRNGDRIGQRRRLGEHLAEAVGPLGQEGFADGRRQAAELVVGRRQGGVERAVRTGVAEALVAGAVGFQQGIADQLDHQGEGDLLLVGTAAVAVVEDVEVFVVADELPQRQDGLGQRQTRQHFPVKVLWHGPLLGKGRVWFTYLL